MPHIESNTIHMKIYARCLRWLIPSVLSMLMLSGCFLTEVAHGPSAAPESQTRILLTVAEVGEAAAATAAVKAAEKPAAKKPATKSKKSHKVQAGETLFNIAKRYGMSVPKLMDLNNMVNTTIHVGQVIKLK